MCAYVYVCCVLCLAAWLCPSLATPWTVAHQAPLFMGILQGRILDWIAIPFSRDPPNTGIKPRSRTLQVDSLPSKSPGKPLQSPGCLQRAHRSQSFLPCPFCPHRAHWFLSGYPWALWPTMARLAQKAWSPCVCPEWTKSLSPSGPFVYLWVRSTFLVISLLLKNQINQLDKIAHRGLRASNCFFNFVSDVWDRLAIKCIAKRACSLGKGDPHLYTF